MEPETEPGVLVGLQRIVRKHELGDLGVSMSMRINMIWGRYGTSWSDYSPISNRKRTGWSAAWHGCFWSARAGSPRTILGVQRWSW